jgi:hypothetical protein
MGATPTVVAERLKQLIQILDDPRVQTGAVIRLRPIEQPSRLRQALENRKSIGMSDALDVPQSVLTWQVVEHETHQ